MTQREVASLVGFEDRSAVSRIEQGKQVPQFETSLALQILFGVAPSDLFPRIFDEIEEQVMRRALEHFEATIQSSRPREVRKRACLEAALHRATERKGV